MEFPHLDGMPAAVGAASALPPKTAAVTFLTTMRVLYSGGSDCDQQTLKRLLLLADEIAFMDRPSVTFSNWGTVGTASPMRQYTTGIEEVRFSVHAPPSGPVLPVYQGYIEADLRNPEFRAILLDGLSTSDAFARKLISPEANYSGGMTGKQIRNAIIEDPSLREAALDTEVGGPGMFTVGSADQRRKTLAVLVVEASIHVTNALLVSEEIGCVPLADEPFLARLLAMRTTPTYIGGAPRVAPYLGIAVARSVIPDAALEHLSIGDILNYRVRAREPYAAWSVEMNSLAAKLDDISPEDMERVLPKLLATEIEPKILEYRNAMKSVGDGMFGEIVRRVALAEYPAVSIATLTHLDLHTALALFAAALLPSVPAVTEYVNRRRDIRRKHGIGYLLGVAPDVRAD